MDSPNVYSFTNFSNSRDANSTTKDANSVNTAMQIIVVSQLLDRFAFIGTNHRALFHCYPKKECGHQDKSAVHRGKRVIAAYPNRDSSATITFRSVTAFGSATIVNSTAAIFAESYCCVPFTEIINSVLNLASQTTLFGT